MQINVYTFESFKNENSLLAKIKIENCWKAEKKVIGNIKILVVIQICDTYLTK